MRWSELNRYAELQAPTDAGIAQAGTTRLSNAKLGHGERKVIRLTQADQLARPGPHHKLDGLVALLEMKCNTIYNKDAMAIETARGRMTNADVADAIQAALIVVQRPMTSPTISWTSCTHFVPLPAVQLPGVQKSAPAARGPR